MDKLVMTPGPTECSEEVRRALSIKNTNTDLDLDFFDLYNDTCEKSKILVKSKKAKAIIMLGEAILGLESACASFIEEGDKVLCIDNGIYGKGFGDFVDMYGGEKIYFTGDSKKGIDVNDLEKFIDKNGPFKLATLVHCETPTGIINPIEDICPLLNRKGILSIVDAVSSYGGEEILMDDWHVDLVIAGSQKCLSATAGATLIFLSQAAVDMLENRKTPIKSFYANIKNWLLVMENQEFPYTQSDALINSLNVALDQIIDSGDYVKRHKELAKRIRETFIACGFHIYGDENLANTVTAIEVPRIIDFNHMFNYLKDEKNIIIAGSLEDLSGKLFRIGHMGENTKEEKIYIMLKGIDEYFDHMDLDLEKKLHIEFAKTK